MPNFKSDLLTLRDLDANGNGLEYILFQTLCIQIPLWHNKKAIRKTSKCILVNFIQSKRKWKSLCWRSKMLFSFERIYKTHCPNLFFKAIHWILESQISLYPLSTKTLICERFIVCQHFKSWAYLFYKLVCKMYISVFLRFSKMTWIEYCIKI